MNRERRTLCRCGRFPTVGDALSRNVRKRRLVEVYGAGFRGGATKGPRAMGLRKMSKSTIVKKILCTIYIIHLMKNQYKYDFINFL